MAVTAAQHQRTVQCNSAAVLNIVLCNSQVFPTLTSAVVVTGEYSQLANEWCLYWTRVVVDSIV